MLTFFLGPCRLELKFSCFALLAFCCLFAEPSGGAFLLLAMLLHEAAHLAVLFCFHAPPGSVRFSALGCRMVLDPSVRLSYRQNMAVSLAGPASNLLSFAISALFLGMEHPFVFSSLGLGVLHSLPVEPLDGGLALRAFLSGRLQPRTAERLSAAISCLVLVPLAALGFLVLLRTRYNFSLLAMSLYLMLCLLLKEDLLDD